MIRFGLLCGVSRDTQMGDDKASIPDQIKTCRAAIQQLGGREVALYVMDGYSRSGYDSLSDALGDIPPLKEALEAAEQNIYDVLILDNFDRLGDLGMLVHTRFKKYRKQLYSARQSGRLQDPSDYNPNLDESAVLNMHVQGIIQSYRIQKLQRGYQLGVQKRVEQGKYAQGFPCGYRKNVNGELELDEPYASLLVMFKDQFLEGKTLPAIAKAANESGIPSPRSGKWHAATVHNILSNPFYSGKVFRHRWLVQGSHISQNTGRRNYSMKRNRDPELYDGNHPPLWTYAEYRRIYDELFERGRKFPRHNFRTFSGLLLCPICGKTARYVKGQRGRARWRCDPTHANPINILDSEAGALVGKALSDALKNYDKNSQSIKMVETNDEGAILAIDKQIARVQQGYEKELYTADQAKEKIGKLKGQKEAIRAARLNIEEQQDAHERMAATRDKLLPKLDAFVEMLSRDDMMEQNNRTLRNIVKNIVVKDNKEFIFQWR
jgi:hypothetical protein